VAVGAGPYGGGMSTPPTAGEALVRFSDAIDAEDWEGLAALLAEGFTARFPATGETFDRDAFVVLNRDYPGSWRFAREAVVDGGASAALRARVSPAQGPDDEVHHVASFATVDGAGLISELVEVWAEATAPPEGERRPVGS
jgi:hypothetical protein